MAETSERRCLPDTGNSSFLATSGETILLDASANEKSKRQPKVLILKYITSHYVLNLRRLRGVMDLYVQL